MGQTFLQSLPNGPLRCFRVCCGGCLWTLCSPFLFVYLIFPFLGPAALLLKLRQVAFVSNLYVTSWTWLQWLSFFGFVNNVVKVTASETVVIDAYQTALFFEQRVASSEQERREEHYDLSKLTKVMISCAVLRKTQSILKAWIILNSWSLQPEVQLALLRFQPQ